MTGSPMQDAAHTPPAWQPFLMTTSDSHIIIVCSVKAQTKDQFTHHVVASQDLPLNIPVTGGQGVGVSKRSIFSAHLTSVIYGVPLTAMPPLRKCSSFPSKANLNF